MTAPHRAMTLDAWVEMFRDIYYPTQNYERSRYQVFTRLVKHMAGGSQNLLRKQDAVAARQFLGKFYAWFAALVVAVDERALQEVVWAKYPGVCPRCLASPCSCSGEPQPIAWGRLRDLEVENSRLRPRDLRGWQGMFAAIYPGPVVGHDDDRNVTGLCLILNRLAEELGELGESLSLDARIDDTARFAVRNELADVFAWIMALCNSFHFMGDSVQGIWLADVAWSMYPNRCFHCQEHPCQCVRGRYRLELASVGAAAPSQFDERTGLANYRALERMLSRIGRGLNGGGGPQQWSLVFFDLDNFGEVNKRLGHDVGDDVLRSRSELAVDVVGTRGTVFRRGGEEFVVLLHDMGKQEGRAVAEQIRYAFEHQPFEAASGAVPVTCSVGVACLPAEAKNGEDLASVAEARQRLAKAGGKNRVVAEG